MDLEDRGGQRELLAKVSWAGGAEQEVPGSQGCLHHISTGPAGVVGGGAGG